MPRKRHAGTRRISSSPYPLGHSRPCGGGAIESEVRKQDTELIRQLVEALEAMQSEAAARSCGLRICDEAIALGRARLKGKL